MTGAELAQIARTLVGIPFRLHGRDPATGLDCVGVLAAACAMCGRTGVFPGSYTLRSLRMPPVTALARELGLQRAQGDLASGDVVLLRTGPAQHHLAIATAPARFVHAHAGLRRVVEGPIPASWPVLGHWRPALPETDIAKEPTWQL